MHQPHQQTDFTEREDVIMFGHTLSASTYNVKNIKKYRKMHQDMAKKHDAQFPSSTQCTYDNGYVHTIDHTGRADENSHQKLRLNLEGLSLKRNSATAGGSRKRNSESLRNQMRTMHLANNISMRQNTFSDAKRQTRSNKYASIEKKYNRGPLKQKYLSCWLNSVLMEACFEEKFDVTVENPALVKFNLDENSLKSKGIRPENLTRIYKSLFVYSVGFNDLLNEICDRNMNLRKTIWKVFAILLEYCAQGSFEAMLAEIERDKIEKIDRLTTQIKKRQKIIDENAEINQNKNAKIYKQIKQLRQDNKNLIHEKQVILEEFKQAEQAFNQEVALRLRYENKINEIHGVYSQVQTKHLRLQHDHAEIQKEVEKLRALTASQATSLTDLRSENENKSKEISQLLKKLKYKQELIDEMNSEKVGSANETIQNLNSIKSLKSMLQQKSKQVLQLNLIINNTNLLFETEKSEHQQTSITLKASLEQNSKLHKTIQEQMKDLNEMLLERKSYGFQTSEIKAEAIIARGKLEEKVAQVRDLKQQMHKYEQQARKALAQAETERRLRVQVEENLQACHQNISEMKNAKNLIEQELIERRKKMEAVDELIASSHAELKQLKQREFKLLDQLNEAGLAIKTMESKAEILAEKLKSAEEIANKKFASMKKQKELIEKAYMQFDSVKQALQLQRDRLRERYEAAELDLKNEKFQRTNLGVFYKSSLNTGQEKSEEIKKLDIHISQLQEEIGDLKRKLKNVEFVFQEKEKQYKKEIRACEQRVRIVSLENKNKKHYVHPMIFEDAAQNYHRIKEKYDTLRQASSQQMKHFEQTIRAKQNEVKRVEQQYKTTVVQMNKNFESVLNKKENQILYESTKWRNAVEKNKELEENLLKYEGAGKKQSSTQREEKYLQDIKQKKHKIDQLLSTLNEAHNANQSLRENYLNYQTQLQVKEQQLQKVKQELDESQKRHEKQLQVKEQEYIKKIEALELQNRYENLESRQRRRETGSRQKSRQDSAGRSRMYQTLRPSSIKKQTREEQGGSDSKRADFAKKYKGAYIYYHK